MKKVLFIAAHEKNRAPNQRFRFEQYIDFLEQNNFQCELSNIISEKEFKILYSKGNFLKKVFFVFKSFFIRYKDLKRANQFDIVFIAREAMLTRNTFFERKVKKSKAKVIFDFDDSIWLQNISEANKTFKWLKGHSKTAQLISLANLVFAGNQYLADFALENNKKVVIIPTTIDTNEYLPKKSVPKAENEPICIGWSGSITTIKHFEYAIPFLKKIKEKYGEKVNFKVIGDANYRHDELDIRGLAWNKQTELDDLQTFDIGIMPLPNDEWSKGKCGLKGLQYMALEIPTIMSPVGVNTEIITDGENGFLADEITDWVEKISRLIESKELRNSMGKKARETVQNDYSTDSQKDNYLKYFNQLIQE